MVLGSSITLDQGLYQGHIGQSMAKTVKEKAQLCRRMVINKDSGPRAHGTSYYRKGKEN